MAMEPIKFRRAPLAAGQLICVVQGKLRGLNGALISVGERTVLMRLTHTEETLFLRVPVDLVTTDDESD